MLDSDKKKFAEIMMGLADNFSAAITKPGMKLRFDVLREFNINQIESAAINLVKIRTIMGMPTTAEIIVAIKGSEPSELDNATNQVNLIMQQLRNVGSYGNPGFEDPVTNSLMSTRWSWSAVCKMTEAEHKWWAKEFAEAYVAHKRASESEQKLRLLAGGVVKSAISAV